MEGSQQLSNLSTNQSAFFNSTETRSRVYVFLPAGFTTKLVIVSLLVTLGIVGFVGNCLIYYFISKKKRTIAYLRKSPFVRNLNFYIKSLALSDILCTMISIPLTCIQVTVDVFQQGWPCKIVKFLTVAFPCITTNILIVISMERYLSTRAPPRTFSVSTVRKLIWAAWIAGSVVALGPSAAVYGMRYVVDDSHYTIMCRAENNNIAFRIIGISCIVIQHFIPSFVLIYQNIAVIKTMWSRERTRVDIQSSNAIKASLRAATIRGTYLLVAITFAFIIPYSVLLYYNAYVMVAKPFLDFEADFISRYAGYLLVFSNSAMNFVVYLVQMKDFRLFIKKTFCGEGSAIDQTAPGNLMQLNAPAPNNNGPHGIETL